MLQDNRIEPRHMFFNCLCFMMLIEVVFFGGGRLFSFGFISPRMYLFSIALLLTPVLAFSRKKISMSLIYILIIYLFYLVTSAFSGIVRNYNIIDVVEEIKPLLYFLLLPFVYYNSTFFTRYFIPVIKSAAAIMGITYFVIYLLLNYGVISFDNLYIINNTGEFFFRGETAFVYKGFIFIVLGCFAFLVDGRKRHKLYGLMLLIPLYLTFTRGFLISLYSGLVFFYFIRNQRYDRLLALFAVLMIPCGLFYLFIYVDRVTGDSIRINDIMFLLDFLSDVSTLVFGSGFGSLIGDRLRVETVPLEVLYKSGFIGILFWISFYVIQIINYFKIVHKNNLDTAMLAILTQVYIQSIFNPYINNPIGLFVAMISFVYLQDRVNTGRPIRSMCSST